MSRGIFNKCSALSGHADNKSWATLFSNGKKVLFRQSSIFSFCDILRIVLPILFVQPRSIAYPRLEKQCGADNEILLGPAHFKHTIVAGVLKPRMFQSTFEARRQSKVNIHSYSMRKEIPSFRHRSSLGTSAPHELLKLLSRCTLPRQSMQNLAVLQGRRSGSWHYPGKSLLSAL